MTKERGMPSELRPSAEREGLQPDRYETVFEGRKISYKVVGDPNGYPVFSLHGTPGSSEAVLPRQFNLACRRNLLIIPDRPGYGDSDPNPGRSVASIAPEIAHIADVHGIDFFSVWGKSGGGPHALACAALLSHRVKSALVEVSLAPYDAKDLDWFAGMTQGNVDTYQTMRDALDGSKFAIVRQERILTEAADRIREGTFIKEELWPQVSAYDRVVLDDPTIRQLLTGNFAGAIRNESNMQNGYIEGQLHDHEAFVSPWGFDPAAITCPTLLWHGKKDEFSPPSHTEWLARNIPSAIMDMQPKTGHFGAVDAFPHNLSWLTHAAKGDAALGPDGRLIRKDT